MLLTQPVAAGKFTRAVPSARLTDRALSEQRSLAEVADCCKYRDKMGYA